MENLLSEGFNGKPVFRRFQWKTCFQEVSMVNLFSGGFSGRPVFRRTGIKNIYCTNVICKYVISYFVINCKLILFWFS